jgi:hypothetical protein
MRYRVIRAVEAEIATLACPRADPAIPTYDRSELDTRIGEHPSRRRCSSRPIIVTPHLAWSSCFTRARRVVVLIVLPLSVLRRSSRSGIWGCLEHHVARGIAIAMG